MNTQEIKSIIAEELNIPFKLINDNSAIEDIDEWDSLSHMTIIMNIEKKLSVQFTGEIIAEMTSISSIKKAIDTSIS